MGARPAFVLECSELKSDSSWKGLVSPAQEAPGWDSVVKHPAYYAGNWMEKVDGRKLPEGWQTTGFDDSRWPAARQITRAEIWGEGDTRAPWKLLPRTILPLEDRPAVAAKAIQAGIVNGAKAQPPYSLEVEPSSDIPALPYSVPADGKIHYLVFDAGMLVTAYPMLELEGGEGATVEMMYAEAPSMNGRFGNDVFA